MAKYEGNRFRVSYLVMALAKLVFMFQFVDQTWFSR